MNLQILNRILLAIVILPVVVGSALANNGMTRFVFDPAVGETRTYQVVKTRETHANGEVTRHSFTMSVPITVIEKNAEGFILEATFNDITQTDPFSSLDQDTLVADLARLTEGFALQFQASETGVPIAMSNMDALKAELLPSVFAKLDDIATKHGSTPRVSATTQQIRQNFENMNARTAAAITLRDIQPVFIATGLEVPTNEPQPINKEVPWELTGSNLVAVGKIEIAALNNHEATIRLNQNYTRESVRNGIAFLLAQMAGMDKASMERATKQIRAWEDYDIQTEFSATLPLSESWPRRIDHTQTFIAAGQKQITNLTYRLTY